MRVRSVASCLPLALALALAGACSSTPNPRYFVLEAIREPAASPTDVSIVVGPVTVPEAVDRPQFVLSERSNEVLVDDLHRWASPLQDSLADILASDLGAQLGSTRVATSRHSGAAADYRVSVAVLGFRSRLGDSAQLEASWTVRRADGAVRTGRTELREGVEGRDHAQLAAAHSRAISKMSTQIAEAIRALALEPLGSAQDSQMRMQP